MKKNRHLIGGVSSRTGVPNWRRNRESALVCILL
jgi:hypothetical protein